MKFRGFQIKSIQSFPSLKKPYAPASQELGVEFLLPSIKGYWHRSHLWIKGSRERSLPTVRGGAEAESQGFGELKGRRRSCTLISEPSHLFDQVSRQAFERCIEVESELGTAPLAASATSFCPQLQPPLTSQIITRRFPRPEPHWPALPFASRAQLHPRHPRFSLWPRVPRNPRVLSAASCPGNLGSSQRFSL